MPLYEKMNITKLTIRPRNFAITLGALIAAASVATTQAAVTVNHTVTFDEMTNLYRYSYSIQNTGMQDIVLLTIPVDALANITGISTPSGFSLTFDPVAQVNSFFEDNDIFTDNTFATGIIVSPFIFDSPLAPKNVTYTAFDVDGMEFRGTTVSPIPETSSALLSGIALVLAITKRRRNPSFLSN